MRFSSLYIFRNSIDSMNDAMVRNNRIYTRLSAGQLLLKPSDDPAGASQAISYESALATIDQFGNARLYAKNALGLEDTTLNSISNLLTKNLTDKIAAAGNETYSDKDREALAKELKGIRNSLRDLGNTSNSSGRYIFSGYNTGTKPFDEKGVYQGGNTAISQSVGESTTIEIGHTGKDLFLSGTPDDVLATLDGVIEALNKPLETDEDREALQAVLKGANESLKKGIDNLGKIQAQVGTSLQQIESLTTDAETYRIQIQGNLDATLGRDPDSMIRMIGENKMAEFSMTASMTVFQAMQRLSIFAALR